MQELGVPGDAELKVQELEMQNSWCRSRRCRPDGARARDAELKVQELEMQN